ncbi:MAG: hypothetical protein AB4352_20020 [Hormoscilla sp.]
MLPSSDRDKIVATGAAIGVAGGRGEDCKHQHDSHRSAEGSPIATTRESHICLIQQV